MNAPAARRLLVDVTQYVNWPARSGVQRVLLHLANQWRGDTIDGRFGFLEEGHYTTGPVAQLGSVIRSTFRSSDAAGQTASASRAIQDALLAVSDKRVPVEDIENCFDAYLLPEPSLRKDNLAVAERLRASQRTITFFIYYDALPLTHPHFFPSVTDGKGAVTRYHQVLSRAHRIAFISQAVREVFERRLARRPLKHAIVARPGADGLERAPEPQPQIGPPTFTVLGTIEPRKGHRLVLEAFERLWAAGRDYELVFIGAPGPGQPDFLARVRAHSAKLRLVWIEDAEDEIVANALARSSAMVFLPFAEGYGLPPLEALASYCPVIVPAHLPALEDLSDAGQIRLETVTVETIASAVETLAGAERNAEYRRATTALELPTWKAFAGELERWINSELEQSGAGGNGVTGRESRWAA